MQERFSDISFADNRDPRCPVVIILDKSESMNQVRPGQSASPIDALNSCLDVLTTHLNQDKLARRRVEVSFVSYSTHVEPATDFKTVDEGIIIPVLNAEGITSTGAALNEALDAVEKRKEDYKRNGVDYYRPIVMLITDGLPTDSTVEASERLKKMQADKKVSFFPIAVEGADMDNLASLSSTQPLKIKGVAFDSLFAWLSASVASVSSSQVGDRVPLESPAGWAEL